MTVKLTQHTPAGAKVRCIQTWRSKRFPDQNYGVEGQTYTLRGTVRDSMGVWTHSITVEEIPSLRFVDLCGAPLYEILAASRFQLIV